MKYKIYQNSRLKAPDNPKNLVNVTKFNFQIKPSLLVDFEKI